MGFRTLIIALGLVLGGAVAHAEEGPHHPCRADVEKFCKDVQPGGGRIIACLKQHEGDLSDSCKAAGERMRARANAFRAACQGDLDQFCKDVEPGGGRLIQCLKAHEPELSAGCHDFASRHRRDEPPAAQ